jgi:large conductance mechanosensitive channel
MGKNDKASIGQEFRAFVLHGNMVNLAIAVVIGTAFGAVVSSLVAGLITPLIAAIFGKPNFAALAFKIHGSTFDYGIVLNALITFLITAFVIFFFVVKPLQQLIRRMGMAPAEPPQMGPCPQCLTDIPVAATRCSACTSELGNGWSIDIA